MSKVITILQQKGGSTKTTTCMNIAGALIEAGYRIKIVDLNTEQQSAGKWAKRDHDFQGIVVHISEKQARQEIERLCQEADFVIIDTPPELMASALKAALLSDLLIIPCSASSLDLEAAEETVQIAEMTRKPFRLLASNVNSRTRIGKKFPETLKKLGPTFKTIIHHKVGIVESAMVGQWVGSYSPQSEAHLRYRALASEIVSIEKDKV